MTFGDHEFTSCPTRLINSDPRVQAIIRLYNAKEVSPLHGWPQLYLAWSSSGVVKLSAAIGKKRVAELEKRK